MLRSLSTVMSFFGSWRVHICIAGTAEIGAAWQNVLPQAAEESVRFGCIVGLLGSQLCCAAVQVHLVHATLLLWCTHMIVAYAFLWYDSVAQVPGLLSNQFARLLECFSSQTSVYVSWISCVALLASVLSCNGCHLKVYAAADGLHQALVVLFLGLGAAGHLCQASVCWHLPLR